MSQEENRTQDEIARLKKWNRWFYDRVRFMRDCQKEYFKARRNHKPQEECEALKRKSMAVEQEVDREIERIEKIKMLQSEPAQMIIKEFDCVIVK